MAVIREFDLDVQGRERDQPEAIGGRIVPLVFSGEKFLQLNSYGSEKRVHLGARSQNIRLSREAFLQLMEAGKAHFGLED
ncbi:hypothetical protein [Porphyrobacter sp. AAP82]|uniref:hypothetical protein n=1 Tax=Porphyrobacter sp. AAP82 TaxID=1248917 RepID=UPI00036CD095|nr:hypothetical protein [Porphyrobacter sp. AAP82]